MIACGPPESGKKKGEREKRKEIKEKGKRKEIKEKGKEKRDKNLRHLIDQSVFKKMNRSHYLTAEKQRNLVKVTSDNQQTMFSVMTQARFYKNGHNSITKNCIDMRFSPKQPLITLNMTYQFEGNWTT